MAAGDFCQAWSINDEAHQHWPSAHQLWKGQCRTHGQITLASRHGLGDAVQMMQYAGVLCDAGISVLLRVPPALAPLLPFFKPFGALTGSRGEDEGDVEMMELPYLFRTQVTDLPISSRYLCLPQTLTEELRQRLGDSSAFRVGLVWRGGDWDRSRWIPPVFLDALADIPNAEFWNLQDRPDFEQPSRLNAKFAGSFCKDGLVSLAAAIANMDVLVTVDTLAAHLAGALGVRTLLLLKHDADWRWLKGFRSPWYSSMEILRQPAPGEWAPVVAEVRHALTYRAAFLGTEQA